MGILFLCTNGGRDCSCEGARVGFGAHEGRVVDAPNLGMLIASRTEAQVERFQRCAACVFIDALRFH